MKNVRGKIANKIKGSINVDQIIEVVCEVEFEGDIFTLKGHYFAPSSLRGLNHHILNKLTWLREEVRNPPSKVKHDFKWNHSRYLIGVYDKISTSIIDIHLAQQKHYETILQNN